MRQLFSNHKFWVIVGGIVLLILLVWLVDVEALIALLFAIHWTDLLEAAFVLLLGYLLLTVRLRYILFNGPGWWETFYANSIGYMVHITVFIPAMVARTVTTGWVTSVSVPQASSGILIERLLEQVMRLFAMVLVIILLTAETTYPTISIGGSLIMLIVMFGALFWVLQHGEQVVEFTAVRLGHLKYFTEEQIRQTASSILEGLEAVRSTRRLLVGLLLSILAWSSFFIFQYLVLNALPLDLPVLQMLLISAVVLAVMPPSINVMMIVYQMVVTLVLVMFQLTDTTTAIVYAIILHLIQMICWIILGRWSLAVTDFNFRELIQVVKQYTDKKQVSTEDNTA